MSIEELQQQVVEEFQDYDDWMDRYQLLIDIGSEQEPLPEKEKNESNLIDGCQSRVWLTAALDESGNVVFHRERRTHRERNRHAPYPRPFRPHPR